LSENEWSEEDEGEEIEEEEVRRAIDEDLEESFRANVYAFLDPALINMIAEKFPFLLPLTSHLNRLSNFDKKEAEYFKTLFLTKLIECELELPEEAYDHGWGLFYSNLEAFGFAMSRDNLYGFKQRALNEVIREVKVNRGERKRRRWLPF